MNRAFTTASALGLALGVAGVAAADYPASPRTLRDNPDAVKVTLHRSVFDQVGPRLDVEKICGESGARKVEVRRSGWQVAVSILSIGFYTPTNARVVCNRPGEIQPTAGQMQPGSEIQPMAGHGEGAPPSGAECPPSMER
jgi:hypothetical protein